jgi:hypothetical protein
MTSLIFQVITPVNQMSMLLPSVVGNNLSSMRLAFDGVISIYTAADHRFKPKQHSRGGLLDNRSPSLRAKFLYHIFRQAKLIQYTQRRLILIMQMHFWNQRWSLQKLSCRIILWIIGGSLIGFSSAGIGFSSLISDITRQRHTFTLNQAIYFQMRITLLPTSLRLLDIRQQTTYFTTILFSKSTPTT